MISKVFLGDICDIQGGYAFKSSEFVNDGIPLVKIASINSDHKIDFNGKTDFIMYDDFVKYKNFEVAKGDILVALSGATTGKYGIYDSEEKALLNQRVARIRVKESKISSEYIYYYMNLLEAEIFNKAQGAAQPNISTNSLEKMSIPLPSKEKQIEIVEMMKLAGELIVKRQSQIVALEELTQSLFLEMFSDGKELSKGKIGEVIQSIEAGWSVSGEERPRTDDEIAVLKISAVTKGYFKDNEYKVISPNVEIKKAVYPQKGDIIFSRANTRELVGASAIVPKDYSNLILPDKLWKINLCKEIVTQEYFHTVINTKEIRNEFSKNATGTSGSMLNISMQKFKEIEIDLPSINEQKIFSEKVKSIQKLKVSFEKSKLEMENLYNSLLQKAFKGELFQD